MIPTSENPEPIDRFDGPLTSQPSALPTYLEIDAQSVEEVEETSGLEDDSPNENVEEEIEEENDEATDTIDKVLGEIRDELAVTSTENRRNTKRIFDALKQFGGVLDALSGTVNSLHASSRSQMAAAAAAAPAHRTADSALELIELADRVDRITAAFSRKPAPLKPWWPPTRRTLEALLAERELLADSLSILSTHVRSLLKSAGVARISCVGESFDPTCMNAVEVVLDHTVSDHTVLTELLPGWRESGSGRIVRAAQVRVSRAR